MELGKANVSMRGLTKEKVFRDAIMCSFRGQEHKRRVYEVLIERVFRSEEKKQGAKIVRTDIEALEKEISIDIADLRRDVRNLRRDLKLPTKRFVTPRDGYATRKISEAIQV